MRNTDREHGVTGSGARRGGRTSLTASAAGAARQAAGRASTRLQPACAARVCGPLKQWVGWSCPKTTHKGGASPCNLSEPHSACQEPAGPPDEKTGGRSSGTICFIDERVGTQTTQVDL